MVIIERRANERSTLVFALKFYDEDRDPAVPESIQWTLTDRNGTVINDREQVAVAIPLAETQIVLSGADLQILADESRRASVTRRLIIEATYNSSLGTGLPVNNEAEFTIDNLTYIGESS